MFVGTFPVAEPGLRLRGRSSPSRAVERGACPAPASAPPLLRSGREQLPLQMAAIRGKGGEAAAPRRVLAADRQARCRASEHTRLAGAEREGALERPEGSPLADSERGAAESGSRSACHAGVAAPLPGSRLQGLGSRADGCNVQNTQGSICPREGKGECAGWACRVRLPSKSGGLREAPSGRGAGDWLRTGTV